MKYDLIIPLGEFCATATALKKCGLRKKAYPFDWSAGVVWEQCGNCGFLGKINLICNNFEEAFNLEDLEEFKVPNNDKRSVKNVRTGLQYFHDFPLDQEIKDYYSEFRKKYKRRVERLYNDISKSKNILFIFVTRENHTLSFSEIEEGYNSLAHKFKNKNISLLILLSTDQYALNQYDILKYSSQIGVIKYRDIVGDDGNTHIIQKAIIEYIGGEIYHSANICNIGLDEPENDIRWSISDTVLIKLNTKFIDKDIVVNFNCYPYLSKSKKCLTVDLFCNYNKIAHYILNKKETTQISSEISSKINNFNGELNFKIKITGASSPFEETEGEQKDIRKLGVALEYISIFEK